MIRAALMSDPSLPGCRGNSPTSSVPNPNIQTVPSSVIAEIVAELRPIARGVNQRAATHQKANPSADVTAVAPIDDPALINMTLFILTHLYSFVLNISGFLFH
jgi:hypothetical protein